jgi:hypothetical protein
MRWAAAAAVMLVLVVLCTMPFWLYLLHW